jgi:hypothetical protein
VLRPVSSLLASDMFASPAASSASKQASRQASQDQTKASHAQAPPPSPAHGIPTGVESPGLKCRYVTVISRDHAFVSASSASNLSSPTHPQASQPIDHPWLSWESVASSRPGLCLRKLQDDAGRIVPVSALPCGPARPDEKSFLGSPKKLSHLSYFPLHVPPPPRSTKALFNGAASLERPILCCHRIYSTHKSTIK